MKLAPCLNLMDLWDMVGVKALYRHRVLIVSGVWLVFQRDSSLVGMVN